MQFLLQAAARRLVTIALVLSVVSCGGGDAPQAPLTGGQPTPSVLKQRGSGQAISGLVATSLVSLAPAGVTLAIGQLADGGYTVVWCTQCSSPNNVSTKPVELLAQRFDAPGAAAGPQVQIRLDTPGLLNFAGVGVLLDGSIVLAYEDQVTDLAANTVVVSLFVQRYDPTGTAAGLPVEVTSYHLSVIADPDHVSFSGASFLSWSDGSYLVSWTRSLTLGRSSYPVYEAFAQRIAPTGDLVGAPRTLARWSDGSGTRIRSLTAFEDGGYLAAVEHSSPPNADTMTFVPYDSADRVAAIPVDSATSLPQATSVVPLSLGGYLLMSNGPAGPYAQILDNNGAVVAQPTVQPGTAYPLADGGFEVVWVTTAPAGTPQMLAQRYDLLGAPVGSPVPIGPAQAPTHLMGVPLADVGVALAYEGTSGTPPTRWLSTQSLHEPDLSKREQVLRCRDAAKDLVGSQHRQFMSRCVHGAP